MPWQQDMPSCFGSIDYKFCGHTIERQNAREMLKNAIDAGASFVDILNEAESYLKSVGATPQHVAAELDKVRQLAYWFD